MSSLKAIVEQFTPDRRPVLLMAEAREKWARHRGFDAFGPKVEGRPAK
jgi:hypothetical protein